MINNQELFEEINNQLALNCSTACDTSDLIGIAETLLERHIPIVSVPPDAVGMLWTWLEKKPIKIVAQFAVADDKKAKKTDPLDQASKLSEHITAVFKRGAHGARIAVPVTELADFVSVLAPVREDLFFNKELILDLDINDIEPTDWLSVFNSLEKIRATGVVFGFKLNKKSAHDFVGRVYALMHVVPHDMDTFIYFATDNDIKMLEQAYRLVAKMRPDLLSRVRFFIDS